MNAHRHAVVTRADLPRLFEALQARGYCLVGPTIRDRAIIYDQIKAIDDLPIGWMDQQDGGTYRLKKRGDVALFGYAVGPHSWKKFLFPSKQRIFSAERTGTGFEIEPENEDPPKYAFIGVRSCELHAIEIQDKVFMGQFTDPAYRRRREKAFIVAVNCGQAGGTCFCVSMNTGPKAQAGFDLALTELLEAGRHVFLVEIATKLGAELMADVPTREAKSDDLEAAERVVQETAAHMGRTMDTNDIKELLYRNYENPRWDEVSNRCLTCANCTMVCPTCFCSTVEDTTDLTGDHAERWRRWDSCFTTDFSYLVGGAVRKTARSRYRQWMTHKLATWIDQFGTSGCVGCGRCIMWCPVAIDITEEVKAIRDAERHRQFEGSPARLHEK
jgi:sulfhydrogenase subunit beta (sulfur reductase)